MSARVISIVDYGMGNVRSVANAVEAVGGKAVVSARAEDFADAHAIILPGVGAFPAGMQNLRDRNAIEPLHREVIERGKPFLGICLGMQMLASRGTEHGDHAGLAWIEGTVERLFAPGAENEVRLPHMGWNSTRLPRSSRLFEHLPAEPLFYFVHSYRFVPVSPEVVTSTCDYGVEFVASIEHENISAVQFHPEKSQPDGMRLLQNFINRA